jgi:hypothetical protein
MKQIKTYVCSGILIIVMLFSAQSCQETTKSQEKTKLTAEQDSILKVYESPLILGPDSITIAGLIADFEGERKAFQEALNQIDPGLMKAYEKDAKAIMNMKNDNQEVLEKDIATALIEFDKKYKETFTKAWGLANIDKEVIASKYKKWLGNWVYKMGDFGVIYQALGGDAPPPFPADTTFNLSCPTFEVKEENTSCGGIAFSQFVNVGECSIFARSGTATIAGGCDNWGMLGKKVTIPSPVSRVNASCKGDYRLFAFALAIGGGSASTAFVGAEAAVGATVMNNREHARIWAIAPIIWHSNVSQSRTAQDLAVGYSRTAGSTEEVNIKAFGRAGQGSALIGSATSSASFTFINGIQTQLLR